MPDLPANDSERDPRTPADVRTRRLVLVLALVLVAVALGVYVLLAGDGGGEEGSPGAKASPPGTPIARVRLRPRPVAPNDARGLAEVVRRQGRYELRILAENLPRTTGDSAYRVYLSNAAGDKTLGRAATDRRGTLIGQTAFEPADLTRFARLNVALESQASSRLMLAGPLPR